LILATQNAHKVEELGEILEGTELRALPDGIEMPPEDGTTFAANALIKARAVRAATGEEVIADDSGIEIDALDGRPGVRSARFAGENASDGENLAKALDEVAAAGGASDARYVCVIAYIDGQGAEHVFEGFCPGRITGEVRGDGGFGYDPAFIPVETGEDDRRTMAELSPEEKHAISHRGKAARKLAEYLGAAR
jgi:XTP/dITP diphosphohydrolase